MLRRRDSLEAEVSTLAPGTSVIGPAGGIPSSAALPLAVLVLVPFALARLALRWRDVFVGVVIFPLALEVVSMGVGSVRDVAEGEACAAVAIS